MKELKVRSRSKTYLTPDRKHTRVAIHPQIHLNGQWVYIKDDETLSGLAESESHKQAREFARRVVDDIKETRERVPANKGR